MSSLSVGELVLRARENHRIDRVLTSLNRASPPQLRTLTHAWLEKAKQRRLSRTKLVPEQALQESYTAALHMLIERHGVESLGDYVEFGVGQGTSMICMYRALQELGLDGVRLRGFDSFEGLPDSAAYDDEGAWQPGAFRSDYEFTRGNLIDHGVDMDRVNLVKGWFSETLTDELIRQSSLAKASIIMVDCDTYLSAKEALSFCVPLIRDRSIVFFDDWDAGAGKLARKNLGERRAFNEFLDANPQFQAQELADLRYRTADPTCEAYSRVFLVSRKPLDA